MPTRSGCSTSIDSASCLCEFNTCTVSLRSRSQATRQSRRRGWTPLTIHSCERGSFHSLHCCCHLSASSGGNDAMLQTRSELHRPHLMRLLPTSTTIGPL